MAPKNDFDPKKEIGDLAVSINQPEKVAENWCKAAHSQTIIPETLRILVLKLMKTDPDFRKEAKLLIKEAKKEIFFIRLSGIGLFVGGAITLEIIKFIFNLITNSIKM